MSSLRNMDQDETLLTKTASNRKVVQISTMVHAEKDWAFVAQKLGLEEKLPHRRANPHARHYTEYYTPRTRDIIAEKFKVDIERFGYEFAG